MGTISINYSYLSSAASQLKNGAAACRRYSNQLDTQCQNKLGSIEGGTTGYVWDAYSDVSTKQKDLQAKAERLDQISTAIEQLKDYAQQTDQQVSQNIESRAQEFQTANGMECSWIESAWSWLCNGVSSLLNSTEFGQMISDAFRKAGDWIGDKWRRLRLWMDYDGGKYIVGIASAILAGLVAAVTIAGILTGGIGVLAVIAIIGASIALLNAAVKLGTNIYALVVFKDNPYGAEHYAKIEKGSDLLRDISDCLDVPVLSPALDILAGTIDVVDAFCAIVGLVDSVTKLYGTITGTQTLFQKYLGNGGIVDSIFTKDVSTPGRNNGISCTFDPLKNKWYVIDENNMLGDEVDFSEASNLRFSFKTGLERLKAEVFTGSTSLNSSNLPRVTGFEILKSQFLSDLSNFKSNTARGFSNTLNNLRNMVHNGTQLFQYDLQTARDLFAGRDLGSRELFIGTKEALSSGIDTFKSWTGLSDVGDFLQKMQKNTVKWTDTVKIVNKIKSLPENVYKVVNLEWFEFGGVGEVNQLIDKISFGQWSETCENIRQNIFDFGRPSPTPAEAGS